jgi:hypothetical protein
MKTTYEIKQTVDKTDFIEMTTPDGVVSFVPMVEGNADYQAYLESLEPKAKASKVVDEAAPE